MLQNVLIKKKNSQYQSMYENHEIYREIVLHRAKIYMKQLNHDLFIKDMSSLESVMNKKE